MSLSYGFLKEERWWTETWKGHQQKWCDAQEQQGGQGDQERRRCCGQEKRGHITQGFLGCCKSFYLGKMGTMETWLGIGIYSDTSVDWFFPTAFLTLWQIMCCVFIGCLNPLECELHEDRKVLSLWFTVVDSPTHGHTQCLALNNQYLLDEWMDHLEKNLRNSSLSSFL